MDFATTNLLFLWAWVVVKNKWRNCDDKMKKKWLPFEWNPAKIFLRRGRKYFKSTKYQEKCIFAKSCSYRIIMDGLGRLVLVMLQDHLTLPTSTYRYPSLISHFRKFKSWNVFVECFEGGTNINFFWLRRKQMRSFPPLQEISSQLMIYIGTLCSIHLHTMK